MPTVAWGKNGCAMGLSRPDGTYLAPRWRTHLSRTGLPHVFWAKFWLTEAISGGRAWDWNRGNAGSAGLDLPSGRAVVQLVGTLSPRPVSAAVGFVRLQQQSRCLLVGRDLSLARSLARSLSCGEGA